MAPFVPVASFVLVSFSRSVQQLLQSACHGLKIIGVDDAMEVAADELLRTVAEIAAIGLVDL